MIFVLLVLGIVITIGGFIWLDNCDYSDWEIPAFIMSAIGIIMSIICIIAIICLTISVSDLKVIDDKIAMYQEENAKIEEQIAAVVEGYQDYEKDIFTNVSTESAITLVSLYPELKADTLVQSQIEIYTVNNEMIKELKEEKINGSVDRWWLYFGG